MPPSPFKNSLREGYPFRVWALTMLLPAVMFLGLDTLESGWRSGLFSGVVTLVLGTLFSLPALFFNISVCRKIAESNLKITSAKRYIIAIGLGFVTATWGLFSLIGKERITEIFFIGVTVYGSASAIAASLFRLRGQTKEIFEDASFWE